MDKDKVELEFASNNFLFFNLDTVFNGAVTVTKNHKGWSCSSKECSMFLHKPGAAKCWHIKSCELYLEKNGSEKIIENK